jgi:hypothetical protein
MCQPPKLSVVGAVRRVERGPERLRERLRWYIRLGIVVKSKIDIVSFYYPDSEFRKRRSAPRKDLKRGDTSAKSYISATLRVFFAVASTPVLAQPE